MKKDEMGGTCGMHGRKEIYIQNFGKKTWRKETV